MLSESERVRRKLPLSHRGAIGSQQDQERSDDYRLRKAKQNKLNYQKRTAAGLCSHGHCLAKAELGHAHCRKHLEAMAEYANTRRKERLAQNLCLHCGERPQFWGRKCIICRQIFATDPLPNGAKRALRRHREAEAQSQKEQIQTDARKAAFDLIESRQVQGKRAEALRLYVGVDNSEWRTYKEIADLMNLTVERVRQLLLPSKLVLSSTLSDGVPWRPVEREKQNGKCAVCGFPTPASTHHNDAASRILDNGSYLYEECGLPNVVLFGLTVDRNQDCDSKLVSIPRVDDLHRKLAGAVLLKRAALTGREFRFLRNIAGLTPVELGEELGVAVPTVLAWERSESLRRATDLAVRMIIASVISPDEDGYQILKMLRSIWWRRSEVDRVNAYWINDEAQWVVPSPVTGEVRQPVGVDVAEHERD